MNGPTCPTCGAGVDDVIGVEVRGVYDGILYWWCPVCESPFHRWPEGTRLHEKATAWMAKENEHVEVGDANPGAHQAA